VAGIGSTDSVVFWDAATGKRQKIISAGDRFAQVYAVDFSPDGIALGVGDSRGRAVVVPDWKTGTGPSSTRSTKDRSRRSGSRPTADRWLRPAPTA
jgi:hypothetical protein